MAVALFAALITGACAETVTWQPGVVQPSVTPTVTDAALPCDGWDCAIQSKMAATAALIKKKPGHLGIVVRDRETGLEWQAGSATRPVWTASTIKLAIAADLLVRGRAGRFKVTEDMRESIDRMLHVSANRPATNFWYTHGGPAAIKRYQDVFGMTGVHFPTSERLWGAIKCTAVDLAALMSFVLDEMHPDDRAYLIDRMRSVHQVQQWGVWAAGPKWTPGVKDGWNVEKNPEGLDHWVVNSVGFAGPNERYVVAVMYELRPGTHAAGNTIEAGLHAVSDLVATLFGGKLPAVVPPASLLLSPPTS